VWRPHYIQKIAYVDGRPDFVQKPEALAQVYAKDSAWDLVQKALEAVILSGTGVTARVPGILVAGKTGTAQNPHGKDDAWFITYAARPGEAPSIAIAVLVENAGYGAVAALPVAKKMILARFGLPDPDVEAAKAAAERAARRALRPAGAPALTRPPLPGGAR
jgi:penicillin-binding protein 2